MTNPAPTHRAGPVSHTEAVEGGTVGFVKPREGQPGPRRGFWAVWPTDPAAPGIRQEDGVRTEAGTKAKAVAAFLAVQP